MTNLPHPQSFWIVPDQFLAGNYPGDRTEQSALAKLKRVLEAGVNVFIDLTQEHELRPYAHLLPGDATHCRFPIRDMGIPNAPDRRAVHLHPQLARNRPLTPHPAPGAI